MLLLKYYEKKSEKLGDIWLADTLAAREGNTSEGERRTTAEGKPAQAPIHQPSHGAANTGLDNLFKIKVRHGFLKFKNDTENCQHMPSSSKLKTCEMPDDRSQDLRDLTKNAIILKITSLVTH